MTEKTFEEYFPTFAKEVKNEGMRHYLLEKLEGIDKQKVREQLISFNQIPKKFESERECKIYCRNWNKMIKRLGL